MPTLVSALYETKLKTLLKDNYGLSAGNTDIAQAYKFATDLSGHIVVKSDKLSVTSEKAPVYKGSAFMTDADFNTYLAGTTKKNYVSLYSDVGFSTVYNNLENDNIVLSVDGSRDYSEGAPATDADKHNRYIFKVSQHESNEYTCRYSGWFTCYGWLSERESYTAASVGNKGIGRQDNSKRWAALEGKVKTGNSSENWRILQVQPVAAGNYCNYVSFSLPVKTGLVLRIVTGFDVGDNSGKWSNVPGSLTNHIPNAFVGGIYA